jgi:hypothetical protein
MDIYLSPATLSFDWDAEVKDNYVTFHVRLDRGDRHSEFDINLDLARLAKNDLNRLRIILERRHNNASRGPEITSDISWLLNLVLIQDGMSSAPERAARIKELMLCAPLSPLPASPKENLFELPAQNFLRSSTLKDFYEEIKTLPCYPEVRRAWQQAVRAFNIGTAEFKGDSLEEQEELELFFVKLYYEPMSTAVLDHDRLVDKYSSNPLFRAAVAESITRPLTPNQTEMSLKYYILCGWLHSFLWLLSNNDRALLLGHIYGVTKVSAEGVRKAIKSLGLKDWTDFQPKGTPAPCYVHRFYEEQQEMCEILPRNPGQT